MTRVLLDTNVLSELIRTKPDPKVQAFVRAQPDPLISVLTIHEIIFGAERATDSARRTKLNAWIAAIQNQFAGRIVEIDAHVAEQAGRLRANAASQGANADPIDALIAACAITRGAAIATRNVRDFAAFGADMVNPWTV
jgi:predicted nucleic acid-binding protein